MVPVATDKIAAANFVASAIDHGAAAGDYPPLERGEP
jgi:hypothetical protein